MALNREKRRLIERRRKQEEAEKEAERIYDFEEVPLWEQSSDFEYPHILSLHETFLSQLNYGSDEDTLPLEQLAALDECVRYLINKRDRAAREARRSGASWSEIASPLLITRQAAQQRYGE